MAWGGLPYVYHPGRKFWQKILPGLPGRETAYDKCFDGVDVWNNKNHKGFAEVYFDGNIVYFPWG